MRYVITTQFRNITSPYAISFSQQVLLLSNGTCQAVLPSVANGNSYYTAVKDRNPTEASRE